MTSPASSKRPRWYIVGLGALLALTGLLLGAGGVELARLGGSLYYVVVGVMLLVAGVLIARGRLAGAWLFAAATAGTLVWSLVEVGLQFWPLVPRVGPFVVMTAVLLLILPSLRGGRGRRVAWTGAAAIACLGMVGLGAMFVPHGVIRGDGAAAAGALPTDTGPSRWQYYGRTPDGTRYSPEDQITPENVSGLKIAWVVRTGDLTKNGVESQNTPLQIGDTLYACTPRNQILALDADSGAVRWRYDPGIRDMAYSRCRGLGYHEAPAAAIPARGPVANIAAECPRRILMTTVKAQLIALDADTGHLCRSFGKEGIIDLRQQIGGGNPAFYFQTSAPTVARNLVIVGSFVMDGRAEAMPGGVVRAFDTLTGKLVWAFDAERPNDTTPPPPGTNFAANTPNMWSTPAFDDKLGMIYLPLGGGSDDFWAGRRSKATRNYATSILALDIATGHERWRFQTVHHDLWDYDVASQPALYDMPDGHGGTIPALIQPTKTAQIFVLDRRTGKPIAPVEERAVPQGGELGDRTSPTQPFSVGMPQIGAAGLTEASMWGATFFDQLACRIAFRKAHYQGPYTPVSTKPTIFYPGYYGGFNWGGASIDKQRGLLILNDIRMPQVITLVPRAKVDAKEVGAQDSLGLYPQDGGPFATRHEGLMSLFGIPCNSPPWGTMTAIDLRTRQIAWQQPMGTIKDTMLPFGVKSTLPIPLGMPTLGGSITTGSGLVFYSGTQDYYLRALDSRSGDEVWKGRLPIGTQSTPVTYISPRTRKQYVIVSAGGARLSPDHGDYIIAYALPAQPRR